MLAFNDTWLNQDECQAVQQLRALSLKADQEPSSDRILQPLHAKKTFFNRSLNTQQRCRLMEVYAYGDMGITLSLPGYSLTGMMLHLSQSDFSQHCLKQIMNEQCRTFFAVTEKKNGTEVKAMHSTIHRHDQQWQLNADKCYVGKAASAECGMVIARHQHSRFLQPVFISSTMINNAIQSGQCRRKHLPFSTVRAAQMGEISLHDVVIPDDHLIHEHNRNQSNTPMGSQLLLKTFNRMRPSVGAMAMGLARAILDHIQIKHPTLYQSNRWQQQRHIFHHQHNYLMHQIIALQNDPDNTGIASSCKMIGYQTLMSTIACVNHDLTPKLMTDPWIEKWSRDAWGIEFMEGIPAIHYDNILMDHIRQSKRML